MKQIKRVISMILTIALAIGAFSMESYVNAATTVTSLTVSTDEYVLAAGENPKDPGGNGVVTFDTSLAEHISFWAYSFSNEDIYDRMTPFEEGVSYKLCLVIDTPINGTEFGDSLQVKALMKKDGKEYCIKLNMSEYIVDGSKIYYMCDYVMPKLSELSLASPLPDGAEDAELVEHEGKMKYDKYSDKPKFFKFVLSSKSDIKIVQGLSKKVEYTLYNEKGDIVYSFTKKGMTGDTSEKIDGLAAGTYYLGIRGTSNDNMTDMVGDTLYIYACAENTTPAKATTVNLSSSGDKSSAEWQQTGTNGKDKMYYKLVVKEKTYYSFTDSDNGINGFLYKGEKEEGDSLLTSSELNSNLNGELLLDKGTYLLVVYGPYVGNKYKIVINSRDFKDIKKIIVKDVYEVYKGKTKIKVSFDPADNESSVKWSEGDQDKFYVSDYDYEAKEALPKNEAVVYAKSLGEFTSTITTSEGVSQTLKFKVVPAPTKVTKAVAETKSKKKATLKLEWTDTGNYYKIYEKGSKDKDFKLVKETADAKITLNKKPGQTLSYKIESCYKKDGKVVLSSMGSAETVMTAPNKAPSFKTLKQKGSTKYVKPYTKSYWHPATRTRAGYYETVKQGNQSNATVSVKYKKVSGAKYYQANKGNPQGISQGTDTIMYVKNKLSFTYKGKIKPKTEKIKIRAIWKKGVCTAYGPWSKTKKVKIKGNK